MVEHEEKKPAWFRVFYCRSITVKINGILCDSMMSRMKKIHVIRWNYYKTEPNLYSIYALSLRWEKTVLRSRFPRRPLIFNVTFLFYYIILYANFFDNSAISLVNVDVVFFSNFS